MLGAKVAHAELDLAFKAVWRGKLAEAAAAWRDSAHDRDHRFAVKWGPVDADGNGTLALDAENRYSRLHRALRGYNETIDALQALGNPADAGAA